MHTFRHGIFVPFIAIDTRSLNDISILPQDIIRYECLLIRTKIQAISRQETHKKNYFHLSLSSSSSVLAQLTGTGFEPASSDILNQSIIHSHKLASLSSSR